MADAVTPEDVLLLVTKLRKSGVAAFEGLDIKVTFFPYSPGEDAEDGPTFSGQPLMTPAVEPAVTINPDDYSYTPQDNADTYGDGRVPGFGPR